MYVFHLQQVWLADLMSLCCIQILKVTQESLDEFVPANNLRDLLIHEHRKGSMLGLTRNAMSAKKKNLPELQARPISAAGRNPASIEPNPFSPKKPETVSKSSNEGSESFSGDSIGVCVCVCVCVCVRARMCVYLYIQCHVMLSCTHSDS